MAIGTPVEHYAQSLAAQGNSSAFSPATQIDTGRMAFVFLTAGGGKDVTGCSDTAGNTWAVDATIDSAGPTCAIMSCQVTNTITTSDTITVTLNSATSSAHQIWVQAVTGLETSSALDLTKNNTTTGTNVTTGDIGTLNQADEIIWAVMRTNTASTWTKGASFTNATTPTLSSPPSALEYRIVSATTSVPANGTLGTSGVYAIVAATYKMAAAAATAPRSRLLLGGVG